jgi:hypothetical protein
VYGYGLELFGMGMKIAVTDSFLQKEVHFFLLSCIFKEEEREQLRFRLLKPIAPATAIEAPPDIPIPQFPVVTPKITAMTTPNSIPEIMPLALIPEIIRLRIASCVLSSTLKY